MASLAATFCLLACVISSGCGKDAAQGEAGEGTERASSVPETRWESAAERLGVRFVQHNGRTGRFYLPEIMGPGVALFDYDLDGDLDLYVVQGAAFPGASGAPLEPWLGDEAPRDRLFRNELVGDGGALQSLRFVDVTAGSGIQSEGYGMGVAVGDVNGDGYPDLYVTQLGPNRLWLNQQDGTFEEAQDAWGANDPWWSVSAAFLDLDGDDFDDLYVGDYLDWTVEKHKVCTSGSGEEDYCSPASYTPIPDRLFRNDGGSRLVDVTAEMGIAVESAPTLGVVVADFDGQPGDEIYTANDGKENLLWTRSGAAFVNRGLLSGAAVNRSGETEASMGIAVADFDQDADLDLFMTHLQGETNTLYVNTDGLFEDLSARAGLAVPSMTRTGFGTAALDVDLDGALDLFVANGAVQSIEALRAQGETYPLQEPDQFFVQVSPGKFEDASSAWLPEGLQPKIGRGVAVGDLDNDGDSDLVVGNNLGPLEILLNPQTKNDGWLGVIPVRPAGRGVAVGATVRLLLDSGVRVARVSRDGSYASSNDPRALFAGLNVNEINGVEIVDRAGVVHSFDAPQLNQWVRLELQRR